MDELVNLMRKVLADSFAFYLKAHNFHWNVEGKDFHQYHKFFGKLYTEVFNSLDGTAEQIRSLDAYAPGSLSKFSELTSILDNNSNPALEVMIRELSTDNQKVIRSLEAAYSMSERFSQFGLSDFIAGRLDAHKKHAWMLRASMKGMEE
jgi:starvation-inducible DNA-binding protein